MRISAFSRVALLTGALFVVAACNSSGKLQMTQEKVGAIGANKTVSLNIVQSKDVESTRIMQQLRSELFGRLVAENVFRQVVQAEEPADYKLDITVIEASAVSTTARIMLGVFAGSNTLKCDVVLTDRSNGQVKTAFKVEGESAAHPLSSENGTQDAVREAVTNMIIALR
jgi:hypothetical protein